MSEAQEKNKALIRRFFEAQEKGDLDAVKEMMAPNFVDHSLRPGQDSGREGYLQASAEDLASFSEVHHIFEEQLADGDKVISRITISATHDRGEVIGLMPTGKTYEVTYIHIHRIERGKIVEEWCEGSGLAVLVQEQLEQERIERERVEQELRVARRIQQASLPKEVPTLESWQLSPLYRPAREVGGDFYDFHFLSEGRLGLVVGDATGKGVPAALVMSTTCGMLQAVSQTLDSFSPSEVLEQVNETLLSRIPPNMFVTCFYAILDPHSGSVVYANAGHDMPYLHRNGNAEELRARGMPLGLMPGMDYEEKKTMFHVGEAALFYSDGLVEAHNPKGEMFGFPRLRELVAEHGEEPSLEEALLEELYSFVGEGWEQEDDITLVTLRRAAASS